MNCLYHQDYVLVSTIIKSYEDFPDTWNDAGPTFFPRRATWKITVHEKTEANAALIVVTNAPPE